MFDYGLTSKSNYRGITITSKGKKSRGKRYYAEDKLAFSAWKILGYSVSDKDYQKWLESFKDRKGPIKSKEMS